MATIVLADVKTSNGPVIHAIDTVLLPSSAPQTPPSSTTTTRDVSTADRSAPQASSSKSSNRSVIVIVSILAAAAVVLIALVVATRRRKFRPNNEAKLAQSFSNPLYGELEPAKDTYDNFDEGGYSMA